MLNKWSLGGFKSFGKKNDISFAPITVFAGSNSSGKSTVLQSILLLKQTIQYGSANRPLALNGPLIRLGTFDEVIHHGSGVDTIEIDFCFKIEKAAFEGFGRAIWNSGFWRARASEPAVREISGKLRWTPKVVFDADGGITKDRLQSSVEEASLSIIKEAGENAAQVVHYASYRSPEFQSFDADDQNPSWLDVRLDELSAAEVTADKPDAKITQVLLNYFLPAWVSVNFDGSKKRAKDVAEAIVSPRSLLRAHLLDREAVPSAAVKVVNEYLLSKGADTAPFDGDVPAAILQEVLQKNRMTGLGSRLARGLDTDSEQIEFRRLQVELEAALSASYGPKREMSIERSSTLDAAAEYVRSYLKSGVRYLGPLRDDPRPVYPLEALENTTEVGYRGEHTAAVLYQHGSTSVTYVNPAAFSRTTFAPVRQNARLKDAVKSWMSYLGVATDVFAEDAGVFGNRLQVETETGSKRLDLTNVGVGVSQVLPIVVSALIAPATSLLIFEQPELHLHPKVQARLADFFYAMALAGKQCVLETHSEYLIDRLRRRIAEEDDAELSEMISMYFTEIIGGETKCRPIKISKYGSITDWPKDFFEQSQIEAREILEAASAKRQRERRGK